MPIRRGDIYFVNLNPVLGREQAGQRPVLVLSVDEVNAQPLVVTVVVGTKGENIHRDYPVNVRVPAAQTGLPMETVFLCFGSARSTLNGSQTSRLAGYRPTPCFRLRQRSAAASDYEYRL